MRVARPMRADAVERAELAEIASLCAREAGALVGAGYRSRPQAELKGRSDLVTAFDLASQELLLSRIESLAPGIPVVAEEQGASTGDDLRSGLVWWVDPLDGTTNFVHGHPFWSVAVGLAQDDVPILGAVIAPALGVAWKGWVGEIGVAPGRAERNGERCEVSSVERIEDAMFATGFPAVRDRAPDDNFDSFVAVKRAAQAVRRCGSAAMDLCLVADGTYDGYWERRLSAWDVMAASAVALAAGGRVTGLDGGAVDYHVGHLVVSNGRLHDALVTLVRTDERGA